eukprot:m51a1_g1898 hypothetical protein (436) ;mRNA; r:761588-763271
MERPSTAAYAVPGAPSSSPSLRPLRPHSSRSPSPSPQRPATSRSRSRSREDCGGGAPEASVQVPADPDPVHRTGVVSRVRVRRPATARPAAASEDVVGKFRAFAGVSGPPGSQAESLESLLSASSLRVHVITWNMHGKLPGIEVVRELIPRERFHVLAVGTQECQRSIGASMVVASKQQWESLLAEAAGPEYSMIGSTTLGAMHLALLGWTELADLVSDVFAVEIATGIGNVVGNKGGLALSLAVGGTTLLFVSCHLAAHAQYCERRNADWARINAELARAFSDVRPRAESVSEQFDCVFWLGDLNYRIAGSHAAVTHIIKHAELVEVLVKNDQLTNERARGAVLAGYQEGPLAFPPTYKFDPGCDVYDTSPKARTPSWTDRILWCGAAVTQLEYRSLHTIRFSDHRPVFASFTVGFTESRSPPNAAVSRACCVL